jgi:hypothetical protein
MFWSLDHNSTKRQENMNIPHVPAKDDPEFEDALFALVQSASTIREFLMMSIMGETDMKEFMLRHSDLVLNCDTVLEAWRTHLNIQD